MKFKDSLRNAQIREVENIPQKSYGSYFTESGPPSVTIKTQVAGPWLWVTSRADYEGSTLDPSGDTDGYDYSADMVHNWVGEAKTAPMGCQRPKIMQARAMKPRPTTIPWIHLVGNRTAAEKPHITPEIITPA